MGTNYPGTPPGTGFDIDFGVPSEPESTPLSEAGDSHRDHPELHADEGAAIMALEQWSTLRTHDHSGDGTDVSKGAKLNQVNTHQQVDTDTDATAIHHTLGRGSNQAAAGDHTHDYESGDITDKPFAICTSTTRPVDPVLGMHIWETDTNAKRVWSGFPANTYAGPVYGDPITWLYYFDTYTSTTSLDPAYFATTYPVGTSPADGAMANTGTQECQWIRGANADCRAIAQAVVTNYAVTASDNQQLAWVTGKQQQEGQGKANVESASPTNDAYLRMSADGQSYVRFMVSVGGVSLWYTTAGPAGETYLGAAVVNTSPTLQKWTFKATNNTYLAYVTDYENSADGPLVFSAIDYQNVINTGPNYRGWGIGMSGASQTGTGAHQLRPADLKAVQISDQPFYDQTNYQTNLIWQLVPGGAVPHLRLEAHFAQQVAVGGQHIVAFDTKLWDWHAFPFTNLSNSQTDITITESGNYTVHASICWDPRYYGADQSMVGVLVNNTDIGRLNWIFIRGNTYAPGFPQTHETFFTYHFAQGDTVRLYARHNSPQPAWLWWWQEITAPVQLPQMCWIEMDFLSP